MTSAPATLHLLCGKIAAGKSTLAASLTKDEKAVLIVEDAWLAGLYPDEILSIADYVRSAARLRAVVGPHVAALLRAGPSVVLDFPANTAANRAWMREIIDQSGADHVLHWLDTPDAICRDRLRARNAAGDHAFAASDAEFETISRYFEAPRDSEGFHIKRYTTD